MISHALLTAVGPDRIGIVDDLSKAILEQDCNIEESRMALLGGDFAALILVSGNSVGIKDFITSAADLGAKLGLNAQARETSAPVSAEEALPFVLESSSLDGPGIVHSVASILRRAGVNIADMETSTEGAPLTGAPLFTMRASLFIPKSVKIAELRKQLEKLENEANLDLTLRSLSASPNPARF